ncbi:MAG: Gfo/Idh/MocA family oxidoreductase, partial [Clostridia bacterium]|nr:Gfo/Idh/MocA family oxidoreductase [Clostridia bacterium]
MINIGVLGTSGIAERRMIPAIRKDGTFRYAGTAYSTREEMGFQGTDGEFEPLLARKLEKAARFQSSFGGKIYEGYRSLLEDPGVEAVYIALPPALHFRWASEALRRGKHVLLEKP